MYTLSEREQALIRALVYGNAAVAVTGCGGLVGTPLVLPAMSAYTAICLGAAAFTELLPLLRSQPAETVTAYTSVAPAIEAPREPTPPVRVADPGPLILRWRLNDTLYYTVHRHYNHQRISRSAMQAAGFDQRYWSLANACLETLGLKSGRVWTGVSSRKDLERIRDDMEITDSSVSCRTPQGALQPIDLHAAHFLR